MLICKFESTGTLVRLNVDYVLHIVQTATEIKVTYTDNTTKVFKCNGAVEEVFNEVS